MKRMHFGLVVLIAFSTCTSTSLDRAEDVQAIVDRHNSDIAKAYAAGDIEAVVSVFAVDAWQMPPNQAPLIGREAIRQFWRQAVQWGKWDFDLRAEDVSVSGRLAVERGKYVLRFTAGPNSPFPSFEDRGNYLVHWRRDPDGKWRIVADAPVSEVPHEHAP